MESITCREIIIDGLVTLGSSLHAEKVTVGRDGILKSGRIIAASIAVERGGSLQATIEKYVPREIPAEALEAKVETIPHPVETADEADDDSDEPEVFPGAEAA
jgi:hypothetical protein